MGLGIVGRSWLLYSGFHKTKIKIFLSTDSGDESLSKLLQFDGLVQFLGNCRTEVFVSLEAVSQGSAFAPGECSYYLSYFPRGFPTCYMYM